MLNSNIMKVWKKIVIALVTYNLILSAKWLLDNNLLFHTDIARDFYLMKDIWDNKHLTLIGARAGGLTGWFHGPLWLYLNLPAYILSSGNPVIVGWFWLSLHLLTCVSVFVVAKKIFNDKVAFISTLVYSTITILDVHGYINPQGALIIFPIFFYFYWKYKQTNKTINLVLSLFLTGIMIQFQIAFGAPLLILIFIDNVLTTIKDKKISRFLVYFILLIPLSSYILFELRHNFIQIRSISGLVKTTANLNLIEKIKSIPIWLWISIVLVFIKKKNLALKLFLFFYIGFWLMTLFFNGTVMSYYYFPFLPVLVIICISIISKFNKYIFPIIIGVIVVLNWNNAIKDNLKYSSDINKQDWSTWNSAKTAANWTLDNCGANSGYFVYTADLYGYNLRYAMDFQSTKRNITVNPNSKKKVTCLLIGPNVKENPYGSDNWKSGDIKISGKMVDGIEYGNRIKIEKYELEEKDINVEVNPYLIKDTFFR